MTKNYLDNKKFEILIALYLESPQEYESQLIEQLELLIHNIFNTFKFSIDYDDAKQECFLLSLKTLKNFTEDRGSAFNYFTTIILNNLRLIYTKNKNYKNKIDNYIEYTKEKHPELDS